METSPRESEVSAVEIHAEVMETDEAVWIAKNAAVTGDVTFGEKCSVWYGASVRGDNGKVVIGARTNIQDCAVVHNLTTIGSGCTIGHGAVVHGCTVGDNTLIGMGAVVLDGAQVGSDCVVGAGALVTGHMVIPDGSLAMGSPAKVIRPLTEREIGENQYSAEGYICLMEAHRAQQEN
ncbi:gamma carbonic anhydrase family protein [Dysosmobacter acutus]